MNKKFIISAFLFFSMLLMIGVTTVSATDNVSNEINTDDMLSYNAIDTTSPTNNIIKEEINTIEKKDMEKLGTNKTKTINKNITSNSKSADETTYGEVAKQNPILSWDYIPDVVRLNKSCNYLVRLTDENNNPLISQELHFNFNGLETLTFEDGNGLYFTSYSPTSLDTLNIVVTYTGNDDYNSVSLNETREVKKPQGNLETSLEHYTIQVGENVTLYGKLYSNANYSYFAGQNITISINGTNFSCTVGDDAKFSLVFTPQTAGEYQIVFSGGGDENYDEIVDYVSLKVLDKKVVHLFADGESPYGDVGNLCILRGYLYDNNNTRIPNQKIVIRYDGNEYEVTSDDNGDFLYETIFNSTGLRGIDVIFEGTDDYSEDLTYVWFEIFDNREESVITIEDDYISGKDGSVSVTGTLTDVNGNPIPDGKILVGNYSGVSNKNGRYIVECKIYDVGNVTITSEFVGSSQYKQSNITQSCHIKKHANLYVNSFGRVDVGNTKVLSGNLTDDSSIPIPNAIINISINGELFYAVTDDLGHFSYRYEALYAGTMPVEIIYWGNDTFTSSNKKQGQFSVVDLRKDVYLRLLKHDTELSLGDTLKLDGKLQNMSWSPLVNETVTLCFDDVNYTAIVDENGDYAFNVTPTKVGTYRYKITYNGNEIYDSAMKVASVTVRKGKLVHIKWTSNLYVNYGDSVIVKGYLYDANNTKIGNQNFSVKIGNQDFNVSSDDEGDFSFEVTPTKLGRLEGNIIYEGTDEYASDTSELFFEVVIQSDCILTITDIVGVYNDIISYQDLIEIRGNFTDSEGRPIKNALIHYDMDGRSHMLTTDENGTYILHGYVADAGTFNITVYFEGDSTYKKVNASKMLEGVEKINRSICIYSQDSVEYNHPLLIEGTFIKNTELTIIINNKTLGTVEPDNKGYYEYVYNTTFDDMGELYVQVEFGGDKYYNQCNASATFNVTKQNLVISIDPIKQVVYGDNTTITGKITDVHGSVIAGRGLKLIINGRSATTRTNDDGVFTFTTKVGGVGVNNVTANYTGNNIYNPANATATFIMVKQDLVVTVDPIRQAVYGGDVVISGKLFDGNGVIRGNSGVKVFINGKSASATVDSNGVFIFTTKVGVVGVNNVTVSHLGGANYNPTNTSTTFTRIKQDLVVTVDPIRQAVYGGEVVITGKLTDGNGVIRGNTGVKVFINGKSATVKTDSDGIFTLTSKVGKVGINNVTVSHAGGTNYNPASVNTTFTMVKQDLNIVVDNIKEVKFGDSVIITGKFTDANGVARANTAVKVFINGKSSSARTDENGIFTYTSKIGVVGVNNVSVGHDGGANYNPVHVNTTFTVIKQDLKITLYPIQQVKSGENVTIKGTFTDANGVVRTNSKVNIYVNGNYGSAKTDSKGVFTYSTKVTNVGTNNVTVSHSGGTNYNPTTTKATFTVVKQ